MPGADRLRYVNPILEADYPDPDAIRVGDTYWMTASSFNRAPGLPILSSTDLVTWRHVANALAEVPPGEHYALPRHGCGVWAPSIRFHDGVFYIIFPDPDYGIWVVETTDPTGPWSAPRLLLPGVGRIDPCPLWDDDGRTYLVYGWAKSRAGFKNRLSVVEVDAGLTTVLGAERLVVDGDALPGCTTLEGPKFYKREGWYWIFAPAGGVTTGWQTVMRSRTPWGPYQARTVLAQGDSPINGPHQGAWVDTPDGEDWFLHFSDRPPLGRLVMLQPMSWDADGWPVMGVPGPGGVGQPVTDHQAPSGTHLPQPELRLPYGTDELTGSLGPQWHWQANPQPEWVVLPGDGQVTLGPLAVDRGDLRAIPNILAQRVPSQKCTVEASFRLPTVAAPSGWRCGLVLLGATYSWLGVREQAGELELVCRELRSAAEGEQDLVPAVPVAPGSRLHLRVALAGGRAQWRWSTDLQHWSAPTDIRLGAGRWVGAEIGCFVTQPVGTPLTGANVEFGALRYRAEP